MRKVILVVAVVIGSMFMACSRQYSENRMGKRLYTMQELPHKVFALDDSTTQVLDYIHTFEEGDSLLLASYNGPMKNICIFDVRSGKEIRKMQFQKDVLQGGGNGSIRFDGKTESLGLALSIIAETVDPEIFLVGGGVARAGEVLFAPLTAHYKEYAFRSCKETPIRQASLGNDAGIYGAVRLIVGG